MLPTILPQRTYLLSKSVMPTKRSPAINSQSTIATPAILWNNPASGPSTPCDKNPAVGDAPSIQAFPALVANPSPNVLSINAQRNINPIAIRSAMRTFLSLFIHTLYTRAGKIKRFSYGIYENKKPAKQTCC